MAPPIGGSTLIVEGLKVDRLLYARGVILSPITYVVSYIIITLLLNFIPPKNSPPKNSPNFCLSILKLGKYMSLLMFLKESCKIIKCESAGFCFSFYCIVYENIKYGAYF